MGRRQRKEVIKVGNVDQYGVYLPLLFITLWIHQRRSEQEKKQGVGWEGGESQTIFYSITV